MKRTAEDLKVDLLLVDSGDLHDGTGLSDSTTPNGEISNEIFVQQTGYDLLTLGAFLISIHSQIFSSVHTYICD
ncbi:uncharacterized protein PODANS_7_8620 [Podospora anserina S mat+]|uniref:Podospora anserina S mat+ genomic DNA chromosome 7, supercontig 1 n=1 Tax=Podospora anserina (strain S / ATCC MYA-4624 / DSM 980 / FGSC 10383) TaxID=515849 RepID=B2AWX6_PODAN|nr:uncharacterized protein PODANS_7_8620 [Podospora anserina S mat+]CAP68900.1 unnamed protein product [Podospora anserina S mat+]CDP32371.1 Putative protein of unknown function [Podospora anserina S mat+]